MKQYLLSLLLFFGLTTTGCNAFDLFGDTPSEAARDDIIGIGLGVLGAYTSWYTKHKIWDTVDYSAWQAPFIWSIPILIGHVIAHLPRISLENNAWIKKKNRCKRRFWTTEGSLITLLAYAMLYDNIH